MGSSSFENEELKPHLLRMLNAFSHELLFYQQNGPLTIRPKATFYHCILILFPWIFMWKSSSNSSSQLEEFKPQRPLEWTTFSVPFLIGYHFINKMVSLDNVPSSIGDWTCHNSNYCCIIIGIRSIKCLEDSSSTLVVVRSIIHDKSLVF